MIKPAKRNAIMQELASSDLFSYNKLSELDKLAPTEKDFLFLANKMTQQLLPHSLSVIKIPYIVQ